MGLHFTSQDCSLCGNSRKKYNKLADGVICPDCRKPLQKNLRFLSRAWSKSMTLGEVRGIQGLYARQPEYERVFAPDFIQGEFQADNTNRLFRAEKDTLLLPLDLVTGYAECLLYSESSDEDGHTTTTYDGSCLWISLNGLPSVWCRWTPPVKKKFFERQKKAQARFLEAMGPVMSYLRGITGQGASPTQTIYR